MAMGYPLGSWYARMIRYDFPFMIKKTKQDI